VLRSSLRQTDLAARIGGDEFALLLPGADPAIASRVAERVLEGVAAENARLEIGHRVTTSIGIVAEAQRFTTTEAVSAADTAMYTSKAAGGGRITVAEV
jgi:diguanylate cyclase (GGDEF)-like protein